MKAFVMAAGAGTRLRPLTFAIPKPMVPVVNKPVIYYTLENLDEARHLQCRAEPASLPRNDKEIF